jgi:hypothetical protein
MTKTRVLLLASGCWILVLLLGYAASFQSLGLGIAVTLILGFAASTCVFYRGRTVITKRIVKALDYLTLLIFVTGIVAAADIDIKSYKQRADTAATEIKAIEADLQRRLTAQLKDCITYDISEPYRSMKIVEYFLFAAFNPADKPYVYCYMISDLRQVTIGRYPANVLRKTAAHMDALKFLMPPDAQNLQTIELLTKYSDARLRYENNLEPPIGSLIPKVLAYLLVAFAFAVRLTRTTLEVFEWHV